MASCAEVGAVISDLENEYQRSRKFLTDLCRSLESRGILKRPHRIEDSSLATKGYDAPAASIQVPDTISPFSKFDLGEEHSGLSVCSACDTLNAQLLDLNPEPQGSPSSNQCSYGANYHISNYQLGEVPLVTAILSPTQKATSGRFSKKPSATFASFNSMEPSAQDDTPDRAATVCTPNLDSGPLHRRSMLGGSVNHSSELSQSISHAFATPPQHLRTGTRNRRSSLDFIPAPPAHLRKWMEGTPLGYQQGPLPTTASLPSPTPPPGNTSHEIHRYHGASRRRSLEILGCCATTPVPVGNISTSGASPTAAGGVVCGIPGGNGGGGSILSRSSVPVKRCSMSVIPSHGIVPSSQSTPPTPMPAQTAQQQQTIPAVQSPVTRSMGAPNERPASACGGHTGSSKESTLGRIFNQLKRLPTTGSTPITPTISSSGAFKDCGPTRHIPVAAGSSMRCSSSSGRSPSCSGAAAGAGAATSSHVIHPQESQPHSNPSDCRPRSGRFSRRSVGSVPIGTMPLASATAAASLSATAAVATALLNHGHVGRDRDARALSSGEVSERLVPRLSLTPTLGGCGNIAGSSSPLSARGRRWDGGLPLAQGDSGIGYTSDIDPTSFSLPAAGAAASYNVIATAAGATASYDVIATAAGAAAAARQLLSTPPILISPRLSSDARARAGGPLLPQC